MKADPTVRRETRYILLMTALLSVLMQAVFLVLGYWDYTVLLGNLLSGGVAVLNFYLMGLSVQKAVQREEKPAKDLMKTSQTLRMFMLFAAAALGVLLKCFNTVAALVPLFFPRIAIALRPLMDKKKEGGAKPDHETKE